MYSLLICGQVKSRLGEEKKSYFEELRAKFPNFEIVVSTWPGEFEQTNRKFIDTLIINDDPGESKYGKNWSRIIKSTTEAVRRASGKYIIRSRIEVGFGCGEKLQDLLSIISQEQTPRIYFPLRISQYQYGKGLLFAWPDFFHIARATLLSKYWDCALCPDAQNPFHMTTGKFNSLSSDQVLALNFVSKFADLDLFSNRNAFSRKNWSVFRQAQQDHTSFFDEDYYALDFGRLRRDSRIQDQTAAILSPSQLPLGRQTLGGFLFSRTLWQIRRTLYYTKGLLSSHVKR